MASANARPSRFDRQRITDALAESLKSHLFDNSYTLHPRRLQTMAAEAAGNLTAFLVNGETAAVSGFGARLAREGFSIVSVADLAPAARRALTAELSPTEIDESLHSVLDLYATHLVTGFSFSREDQILSDQEQLRRALSSALASQSRDLLVKNHAIDTSSDAVLIADLDCRVNYVNRAFLTMWGYDNAEQLIGFDARELWVTEPSTRIVDAIVASGGYRQEIQKKARDGTDQVVTLSSSLIKNEAEESIGIMVSFVDITDNKHLELQMQQMQKMDDLGQLAGGIVHDFNNLLAAVGGYLQLLLIDAPPGTRTHQDLMQIKAAVDRGAGLTKQLGYFTRQTTGKRELIDLNDTVVETRDLLKHTFPPEISVELSLAHALPAIEADSNQMSQVIVNLCVNAREAIIERIRRSGGSGTGTLELLTEAVELSEDQPRQFITVIPGEYVRLKVKDDGVGMPEEMLKQLFMPFFTTKSAKRGTGLGLAVVYGIVRSHQGFVDVKSVPGDGSTFEVYLPSRKGALPVRSTPVENTRLVKGEGTILVVDDDDAVREVVVRALGLCGYSVVQASNGREALEIYSSHREAIDLIILDMVMPELGGEETLRRLRSLGLDVGVIILTGHTTGGHGEGLGPEETAEVIEKPVDLMQLTSRVQNLIQK